MMSAFAYQIDTNFIFFFTLFNSGKSMKTGWDPADRSMAAHQNTKNKCYNLLILTKKKVLQFIFIWEYFSVLLKNHL